MEKEKPAKSRVAEREEEILKFWKESKIFEKSLKKPAPNGEFVFYEGPPTANAKPALHHLESRAFKDVIPRYRTMRGYHVRRKAGWDTHGLPVELQIEKKLGLKSKKEIEKYGVEAFNRQCKESVFEYIGDWEKFTDRIGYWVDKNEAYYTFDPKYIESVWNILREISNRGLLYKDYKIVPWCPRCGTALSSHELAQGYETVKDLSAYVKLEVIGKANTYLLAWTTTPWTLPGNVALAVGEDIDYVKVKIGEDFFILAKERSSILGDEYEFVEKFKGKDLAGVEYKPLYDFLFKQYGDRDPKAFKKAYKVYVADFVNTEDGTGIVHTAVMYGQDDFELGAKIGLPKFHLVSEDGTFKEETEFLAGKFVKSERTAIDIIKNLAERNLLFKKEKHEHSYPHCWRCKTPLIYYARDSWYIRMSSLRDKLVSENEKINWIPEHIKEGRFGEWLREVKDWAISRERYWGTPLPIWHASGGHLEVVASIDELKKLTKKSGNKYFAIRHGESEKNVKNIINSDPKNIFSLTERGRNEVRASAEKIKKLRIDLIFSSPFERCKETAEIIRNKLGMQESVIIDDRLRELKTGPELEGKNYDEYKSLFENPDDRFTKAPRDGETIIEMNKRAGHFLYELENKYSGKNILIVSHQAPITAIWVVSRGLTFEQIIKNREYRDHKPGFAELIELDFTPLPHNENYELDLHRPYIDEIKLVDKDRRELVRVKEVLDVWFDSGAMPFAQDHYPFDFAQGKPFENKELAYPADYISEAIDQTRGWFYTLHAVGVLMDKGRAYKNVICLGHILDTEGKKMSKSLGNIVDPWSMIEKYGADALRLWMYSVNQPGDSKNFDEKKVDEIVKKVFNLAENILSFYELYKDENLVVSRKLPIVSENILDSWIISRLNELIKDGSKNLDRFKVFEAARTLRFFINDLSTWYIRRSRDRFKSNDTEDRNNALITTSFVLKELSKYMAPFTPMFAEWLYKKVREEEDPESVHLCDFPEAGKIDEKVLENMEEARRIVSLALEKRIAAGIKVRQPLRELKIKNLKLKINEDYLVLIRDEVNVKKIEFDDELDEEVKLNTEITEELKREGNVRELIRFVQELRKGKRLTPLNLAELLVEADDYGREFVNSVLEQIKRPTNLSSIVFKENSGEAIEIDGMKFKLELK